MIKSIAALFLIFSLQSFAQEELPEQDFLSARTGGFIKCLDGETVRVTYKSQFYIEQAFYIFQDLLMMRELHAKPVGPEDYIPSERMRKNLGITSRSNRVSPLSFEIAQRLLNYRNLWLVSLSKELSDAEIYRETQRRFDLNPSDLIRVAYQELAKLREPSRKKREADVSETLRLKNEAHAQFRRERDAALEANNGTHKGIEEQIEELNEQLANSDAVLQYEHGMIEGKEDRFITDLIAGLAPPCIQLLQSVN